MHATQTRYAFAAAALATVRDHVKALSPVMPPTDDDAAFEAWLDACEAVEVACCLGAAEREAADAERAMVEWAMAETKRQTAGRADTSALDFILGRYPKMNPTQRAKVIDLAFRLAA